MDTQRLDQLAPIVIIGSGRSGTNMLRDLLVSHAQLVTWPCDEINYIWRHGNRSFASDEFSREMADAATTRFIRKQFARLQKKHPGKTIVEKTCANSLRCGFVHQIFPAARFVHIIRDGRDVAASAALRWNASLDIPYLLKKARFVPWSDLPYYATRYLGARFYRTFSGKARLSTWGPRFKGMESALVNYELPVGCALQWQACVTAASNQLQQIDAGQVLTLRYEEFTTNPVAGLQDLFEFAGVKPDAQEIELLASQVTDRSVGKWKSQLSQPQQQKISELVGPLLQELGYTE